MPKLKKCVFERHNHTWWNSNNTKTTKAKGEKERGAPPKIKVVDIQVFIAFLLPTFYVICKYYFVAT